MIKDFLKEIRPYSIPFQIIRFGNPLRDGGYGLFRKFTIESDNVYSYGLGDLQEQMFFDLQMANLKKMVFMYDCRLEKPTIQHSNFFYKKAFMSSENAYRFVLENGHSNNRNMLAQIDIEGSEYELFEKVDEKYFDHFSQICVEFHDLDTPTQEKLNVFKRLNNRYYIYHIHANNHTPTFDNEIGVLPKTLEISYLRKDMLSFVPYLSKIPCPISGVDKPCCSWEPDILLNWWCSDN